VILHDRRTLTILVGGEQGLLLLEYLLEIKERFDLLLLHRLTGLHVFLLAPEDLMIFAHGGQGLLHRVLLGSQGLYLLLQAYDATRRGR